ncbi:MAG: NADH-quinone oxidoreductase subunit N [Nitrososphaerales archaeon]
MSTVFYYAAIFTVSSMLVSMLSLSRSSSVRQSIPFFVSLAALLLSLTLTLFKMLNYLSAPSPIYTNLFHEDFLAYFFALTVLLVSLFVVLSSRNYMWGERNLAVYFSLLLFSTLGMVLLSFAADLLMIVVAWELMSIPTYVLAGLRKSDPFSNEASVKYFLLGAFSSGILLYSISLTYGLTGTTNLNAVLQNLQQLPNPLDPIAILMLALYIAGFGLKMSVVPFHMWIPDAYEGAPTTISAFLSAGTKKAGFVVAIRVFVVALPFLSVNWTTAFAILALATMTLGNIAALTQRSVSRMLAYSSIAQAGYLLIGFAVASGPAKTLGLIGVLFHVFNHAGMQSAAFLAVAAVDRAIGKVGLDSFASLWRRMPITALSLAVALLALAGIPPLNGFWSKLVLFTAAIQGDMAWLAVAAVLNSALSLGYYAWVIKRMYIDEPTGLGAQSKIREPTLISAVLLIATAITIVVGIYPSLIYDLAKAAVLAYQ